MSDERNLLRSHRIQPERFSRCCSARLRADRRRVRLTPNTANHGVAKSAVAMVAAAALVSSACFTATADAPSPKKESPVTLESVPDSATKRLVLSAKAAERLDVQLGAVSEQAIAHTQVVGGMVVDPSAGAGSTRATTGAAPHNGSRKDTELWVRLSLSPPEWERLAKDMPARIFPLQTRASFSRDVIAIPTGQPPVDVAKSGMLAVFYVVPADAALVLGDRVRVELHFEGGTEFQKVVPYSAVYYDAKGDAWVYVNTAPLTFIRQPIGVERVSGELAVLSNGPEVGTRVATVAVALLYGAEVFGK